METWRNSRRTCGGKVKPQQAPVLGRNEFHARLFNLISFNEMYWFSCQVQSCSVLPLAGKLKCLSRV